MSKPDGTEQTQWKPDFYYLCKIHNVYSDELLGIAQQAGVTNNVVYRMFLRDPVKHSDAVAVLKAFSQHVGRSWTLDTVRVPVLPEPEETSED